MSEFIVVLSLITAIQHGSVTKTHMGQFGLTTSAVFFGKQAYFSEVAMGASFSLQVSPASFAACFHPKINQTKMQGL